MSIDFAASFDAASPFAAFTSSTGCSIVTGRNSNGAQLGTLLKTGLSPRVVGIGFITTAMIAGSALITLTGTPVNRLEIRVRQIGDGRLVGLWSSVLGTVLSNVSTEEVISPGKWYFVELVMGDINIARTPLNPDQSIIVITASYEIWVNNKQLITASVSQTSGTINNGDIPPSTLTEFSVGDSNFIVDDLYIENTMTRLGDSDVHSDDATITQNASDPRVTQEVIEVAGIAQSRLRGHAF